MMRRATIAVALAYSTLALPVSAAEAGPEYPGAVPAFLEACVNGKLTAQAREQALAVGGWAEEPATIDPKGFGISRALDKNFDYSKAVSVKQWSRSVDGVVLRAVLATFPEKRRYPTLCAVVVPDVKQGWPYDDAFESAVKALGLKGKSTDLPHYFEYSGKIDGNHPVRAELFGRTAAVSDKNSMHLYIAF
ncbi:MAG: hypothetical protein J7499_07730 [Sphingopyxis sp.]|nr:hypothetical protein [Sphingopyxis sp.]